MIKQIYAKTSARISINNQLSKKFDLLSLQVSIRAVHYLPRYFCSLHWASPIWLDATKQIKGLIYPNLTDP